MLMQFVETRARRNRATLFASILEQLRPTSLLDAGGTLEYWDEVGIDIRSIPRVVILNTFPQAARGIETVVGDARDLSRYREGEFDLVFSNSVIGHVGNYADQTRMAREMRRVGKHYFLQTPNQRFPVDWRTWMPFFHWLPPAAQAWCFERFPVGTYKRAKSHEDAMHLATRIRNLRRSELAELFPDAAVVPERFAGFTKSFMVHD